MTDFSKHRHYPIDRKPPFTAPEGWDVYWSSPLSGEETMWLAIDNLNDRLNFIAIFPKRQEYEVALSSAPGENSRHKSANSYEERLEDLGAEWFISKLTAFKLGIEP